ncbi:hypothetical protein BCR42DRAFT_433660 [Absidia repens]|uniref:Membrane anchor Opy2 N-terminal domain-containing protein n=1 Tax=Absidia repens TaxID=90262 RepID=A0A1X2IU53_9FUNG|nr:hypothetical protein BCR42DRAFT_433660 [Absidia repens]
MLKFNLILIFALLSYQILSVNAGCGCQATNQTCLTACGSALVQCIYGCENDHMDACTNGCLDIYWPIIENGDDLNFKLPFAKRDSDPTVIPSDHHWEDGAEDHGRSEKNRNDNFRGDGSHSSHNEERKEGDEFDGGEKFGRKNEKPTIGNDHINFSPDKNKDESHHSSDPYDNFKNGPKDEFYTNEEFGSREGYRNRSIAVTSEAFTKTTIAIITLAITSTCMIAL